MRHSDTCWRGAGKRSLKGSSGAGRAIAAPVLRPDGRPRLNPWPVLDRRAWSSIQPAKEKDGAWQRHPKSECLRARDRGTTAGSRAGSRRITLVRPASCFRCFFSFPVSLYSGWNFRIQRSGLRDAEADFPGEETDFPGAEADFSGERADSSGAEADFPGWRVGGAGPLRMRMSGGRRWRPGSWPWRSGWASCGSFRTLFRASRTASRLRPSQVS